MAQRHPPDTPRAALGKHGEIGRLVARLWDAVRDMSGGDPKRHHLTHMVGGNDQFPAPEVPLAVKVGGTASTGDGPAFMREDAQLIVGAGSPAALGSAAADGAAVTVARADHVHKRAIETTNGGYVRRRLNFGTGFTVTDDGANDEIDVSVAASLTVEEEDGVPSVSPVTTLKFDQADGFAVTDEGSGVVRINVTTSGSGGGSTEAAEEAEMLALMGL